MLMRSPMRVLGVQQRLGGTCISLGLSQHSLLLLPRLAAVHVNMLVRYSGMMQHVSCCCKQAT